MFGAMKVTTPMRSRMTPSANASPDSHRPAGTFDSVNQSVMPSTPSSSAKYPLWPPCASAAGIINIRYATKSTLMAPRNNKTVRRFMRWLPERQLSEWVHRLDDERFALEQRRLHLIAHLERSEELRIVDVEFPGFPHAAQRNLSRL